MKLYQEKHHTLVDSTPVYLPKVEGHHREISQFVECCLKGVQPLCTPEQGLIVQQIVNAIYESVESCTAVEY